MSRLEHGIEDHFIFKRQGRVDMDKMGDIYIPMDCRDQFFYMVRKRQWRYIIYMIDTEDDPTSVFIEKCGLPEDTLEDMVAALPEDRCAWAVIDLDLNNDQAANRGNNKIVFVTYQPDSSMIRKERNAVVFKAK